MAHAPRRAAKKDLIQPDVVAALRRLGALVHIHDDCPWDLTVCYAQGTKPKLPMFLELKSGKSGTLTAAQKKAINEGWPIRVCRSVEEAVATVTGMSAAAIHIVDSTERRRYRMTGVE